jgi:hypothetical protein
MSNKAACVSCFGPRPLANREWDKDGHVCKTPQHGEMTRDFSTPYLLAPQSPATFGTKNVSRSPGTGS